MQLEVPVRKLALASGKLEELETASAGATIKFSASAGGTVLPIRLAVLPCSASTSSASTYGTGRTNFHCLSLPVPVIVVQPAYY